MREFIFVSTTSLIYAVISVTSRARKLSHGDTAAGARARQTNVSLFALQ
jgi:hypothetical protein